jgi:spermidine synthase
MVNWFILFFFLSGLTALIYETAFAHQLHLIFGSTLSAVSIVLAVYMGGIAAGAALIGKRADRRPALSLYGRLEIGVGVTAVLAVIAIPLIRQLYALCSPLIGTGTVLCLIFQALSAILFLLPSTLLMGATLPALSKGLIGTVDHRFRHIGRLYGVNTVGAALGTLLCGFFLLEHLGYRGAVGFGALLNISVGIIAIRLARRLRRSAVGLTEANEKEKKLPERNRPTESLQRLLLVLAGLSGLAALGYEVVWFRTLTFSVVADAYAFALMLGIYLLGIGLGSLYASRRFRLREKTDWERRSAWFELGVSEILISLAAPVGLVVLVWLNEVLPRPTPGEADFWWITLRNTSLQAVVLIFPATFLLGYIFPLFTSLYSADLRKLGGQVGWITAINTTGSILGVFLSAFVMIPLLGIQYSLLAFALVSALVGFAALLFGRVPSGRRKAAFALTAPVVILAFILFPIRRHFGFLQIPTHENAELLFYKESSDQTVMVTQDKGGRQIRRLLINQQQATATDLGGQRRNQLLGHLPLWACPDASRALVICFGSGGTFGALGLYDLERVDCVEICPAVIQAARFFRDWNGDVLSRPNARVIIDDGRSFLLATRERYDIITLEPMHPGLKGVSALYSVEFYREARSKLNPGGVLCQWIPLYSMTGSDARSLIATAVEVFPQSSLWLVGSEGILLCARDSLKIDGERLRKSGFDGEIGKALAKVLIDDPWEIFSGFLMGPSGLKEYTKGASVMRDDRPFTEYTIPRHQHLHPWNEMLVLAEDRQSPLPLLTGIPSDELDSLRNRWESSKAVWIARDRGLAAYQQGDFNNTRRFLETALKGNPGDRYTAYFLKEVYWRYGVEFSRRGRWNQAVDAYRRACRVDPQSAEAHFYLAIALENAGDLSQSKRETQIALKLNPDLPEAQNLLKRLDSP